MLRKTRFQLIAAFMSGIFALLQPCVAYGLDTAGKQQCVTNLYGQLIKRANNSCLYSNSIAQRHTAHVQIVAMDKSETTHQIVANLRKMIPDAQLLPEPDKYALRDDTIFIAVGPAALKSLLELKVKGTIISAFISSEAYLSILENMPHQSASITAIYAEPSPSVQLRLISMLYKKRITVAAILSNKTAYWGPILKEAAVNENAEITIEKVSDGENINLALNRLGGITTIVAIPDSTVYKNENVRNILITSYKRNQSIVGFSASLVKAGALASSYSDVEDIDAQIVELINKFEQSKILPAPEFPKYFNVIVNDDVARSLNIVVDESVRKFSRKPSARQP